MSHSEAEQPSYYPILKQVFASLGFVFFSFQLAPQVWKNWKMKNTEGLSTLMMILWYFGTILLGGYSAGINLTVLLIVQPQIFAFFTVAVLVQILFYGPNTPHSIVQRKGWKFSARFCWTLFLVGLLVSAAVEVGVYFGIKAAYEGGQTVAITVIGYLPTAFIFVGFWPQFWEIYKYKRVLGISLGFLVIDALGGIFNTISLVFHPEFDIPAASCFLSIAACDILILILYYPLEVKWRKANPEEYAKEKAAKAGEEVNVEHVEAKAGETVVKQDGSLDGMA